MDRHFDESSPDVEQEVGPDDESQNEGFRR